MIDQKVIYIISDINKAIAFEWIVANLSKQVKLSFILLNRNGSELETYLINQKLPVYRVRFRDFRDYLFGVVSTIMILRKIKPDVIHCHLFNATLIGLIAGKLVGVKKRIYTRHHSTYNWEYNPKGIWIDKLISALSTDIVAISENVKNVLVGKENVKQKKIQLIHHGFDLKSFVQVDQHRINQIKQKYGIHRKPVVGVIARWIEWKGLQYIIPAFSQFLENYPDAILVLANANGPYKTEIEKMLHSLPAESYTAISFENDLFALYQLFDAYIHTPINPTIEAFGQTYVEALAAGIPSVFTLSGVAAEFIEHERNALVVAFKDSNLIYRALCRILNDESISKKLIENGLTDVQQYNLNQMIKKLETFYLQLNVPE